MEPGQPLRASFRRRRTLALVTESKNQPRRHPFDSFLQKQAQRWQIGDRLGNRELRFRAETSSRQPFHDLIHARAVLSVNLADQVRPQNNLERATLGAVPVQNLYAHVL